MSKVPSASTIRREWLFRIAQIFQVWAGTVAEESAAILRRQLTVLPTTRDTARGAGAPRADGRAVGTPRAGRTGARSRQPAPVSTRRAALSRNTLCEHVTITGMSRSLGCSRAQLTRAFRSSLAVSVHEYLTEIRARHAIHALRSSTEKVEAVARMVGYRSKKDLYRTIRAMTGLTPKRLRSERVLRVEIERALPVK